MKKTILVFIMAVFFVAGALPARSASPDPTESLRGPLNEVMRILSDPRYKSKDKDVKARQHDALWAIIRSVFDFTEVAKRALAQNWMRFSMAERKEFRDLFAELLGNIYIEKIQGSFEGEKVVFAGQEMVTADRAEVKTRVLLANGTLPIDYSVMKKDGRWVVYDVKVEGVSLVKNYRTQFNQILLSDTPAAVISLLRDKVAKQKRGEKVEG